MVSWLFFFFFNDTATTEIYTLSLHDALPIFHRQIRWTAVDPGGGVDLRPVDVEARDRKSTRLNSSHLVISYAVFCLKKKKNPKHAVHVEHQPAHDRQTEARTA